MSKEIFLYSEDNKYKCVVELADSLDKFNCPDHSVMILFEERKDGTYIIAQARDKRLETEKDQKIADLEAKLEDMERCAENNKKVAELVSVEHNAKIENLEKQLVEKQSKIQELNDMYEELLCAKGTENELMQVSADCDFFAKENRKLKQQLAEKDAEIEKWKTDYENCSKLEKMMTKERQYCLDNWRASDQDKISFAIEQLEKAKSFGISAEDNGWCVTHKDWLDIVEFIDNQIKQLKEGK